MWTRPSYVFFWGCALAACRPEARQPEPSPSSVPSPGAASSRPSLGVEAAPVLLASAEPPPAPPIDPPAPLASAPHRTRRVVVLGDSLSDPRVNGGGYLNALAACSGVTIDNFAKGGFMVNQMRRRFEAQVLPTLSKEHTDLIVFGGVNDLYSDETAGRTVEKITADLLRIYDAAKARGMRVTAMTVAPWGGFTRYYNERRGRETVRLNAWIKQQRDLQRVDAVVDAGTLLACGDPERLCAAYEPPFHDGLHFGRVGHQKLGDQLLRDAFPDCRP